MSVQEELAGVLGKAFDQAVESSQAKNSSSASLRKRSSLVPLKPAAAYRQENLPRTKRELALVNPDLRAVIRSLVVGERPWPLFMDGPPGSGKTCAALCVLDWSGGLYYTVSGLCEAIIMAQQGRLEWSHGGRGGTIHPEGVWSGIGKAQLVVLDELGCRDIVSDAHYDAVKRVIDEREWKPLIVISNHPISKIASMYDARIASRLQSGTVINLNDSDRRLT